jgi:hypothetical protein
MLGSAAIFGSKGMVRVPTITGLSTSAAATTAQASGLTVSSTGTVTTYETGLNGIVASQSPSANSLLDYGSAISYTYYVYETPPCSGTRTIWYAYCEGPGQSVASSFEYDHCNVTFEQALAAYFPYGYPGTGAGTASNGGPVSIDCGSGGGGSSGGGGDSGGNGDGGIPQCDPGAICDVITDEFTCTTEFYVYDSSCNCVFSYRNNLC